MPSIKTLIIAAAGTGGHVFPALVVARQAKEEGMQVVWIGTEAGLENKIVPKAGFELLKISSSPVLGKSYFKKMLGLSRVLFSTFKMMRFLKKLNADAVICFGGYVSVPVGLAARLRNLPLYLHEQNAVPGLSNRVLSKFATKIFLGFPNSIKNKKAIFVGNPVRKEILAIKKTSQYDKEKLNLLIVGGSRGAKVLNDIIPRAIKMLPSALRPEIWHQTGEKSYEAVKSLYANVGVNAKVMPFIEDMPAAYLWADLMVCRAGAMTVAEVIAVGLPAIFVPFPQATHDHQTANANYLVLQKAAFILPSLSLSADSFSKKLLSITREDLLAVKACLFGLQEANLSSKIISKL